jgi:Tfp pilus assembly protein PilN
MIQINLRSQPDQASAFLGGIDISQINFPLLIISVVVYSFMPGLVRDQFIDQQNKIKIKLDTLEAEKANIEKELEKVAAIEARLEKMKAQEESFNARLKVIQKVLDTKNNPMQMLHYIAKNVPSDVWLTEVKVENSLVEIKGNALNYDSIGKFIAQLKDSIFYDKNVFLENYTTKESEQEKTRYEEFFIKAAVARFE